MIDPSTAKMDLQLFADEPATESEGTQGSAPDISQEPLGSDSERDRSDVRQMSSFLREFQSRTAAEVGTGQQEPGKAPDNPTDGTVKDDTPAPKDGDVSAQDQAGGAPQTYKLPDGRELTAEQILELEKGHMMQSDYTKKTQALAEERRQLEEQKKANEKAFKMLQDYELDPVGTAIRLQEEAEAKGIFEPKDPQELALEARQRELAQKEQEIQRKEEEMYQQTVYRDLESRVLALETKHGSEFDRNKVIQFMVDEKIYSPEVAWNAIRAEMLEAKSQKQIDALNQKLAKAKEEAVNEFIRSKTIKQNAPLPVGAGGNTGSPPIQIDRPKTLDDARKAAMARPYSPN